MNFSSSQLDADIAVFIKRMKGHFEEPAKHTVLDLVGTFERRLEPFRAFEGKVPGLKEKLDVFEAIPGVIALDADDAAARQGFVRALHAAIEKNEDGRAGHLSAVCNAFQVLRGDWFNPMSARMGSQALAAK